MANSRLKIKTGDNVIVITGKDKKKTGKVVAVNYETGRVEVDGLTQSIKHRKATQLNQAGSLEKMNRSIDISNVAVVHPSKKDTGSRVGYVVDAKGVKKRVYRQAADKEIK